MPNLREHEVEQTLPLVPEVNLHFSRVFSTPKPFFCFATTEFAPIISPPPSSSMPEQIFPSVVMPPANPNPVPTRPTVNICMMCRNRTDGAVHEDADLSNQTDFCDVKALASRLIVGIHVDEVEKKLLK